MRLLWIKQSLRVSLLNSLKRIADKKKKKKSIHTYTKDLIFECQFYSLLLIYSEGI